jgi:hypothetical protein
MLDDLEKIAEEPYYKNEEPANDCAPISPYADMPSMEEEKN